MSTGTPSVWIIVDAAGVRKVQLRGGSWDDEPAASRIYGRIADLVRAMDQRVRDGPASPPNVM